MNVQGTSGDCQRIHILQVVFHGLQKFRVVSRQGRDTRVLLTSKTDQ